MLALSPDAPKATVDDSLLRQISAEDLRWALREGWKDFIAMRGDVLILGFIYPAVGVIVAFAVARQSLFPLLFPLVAGLSIVGPAVASGFYELARRREAGENASWRHFLDPFRGRSSPAIMALGLVLAALFTAWIWSAWVIYKFTLGGMVSSSGADFLRHLFTTREGWTMIVLGNLAGFGFAAITLAISIISFPMLVDRRERAAVAVAASIQLCLRNPWVVTLWGVWVAAILAVACIPLFIGLAVALPVLGYSTWRLYTRAVAREPEPSEAAPGHIASDKPRQPC
jgi:uncharacterized membrane protein